MKNQWLIDRFILIEGKHYFFKFWQLEEYGHPFLGNTMTMVLTSPSRELVDVSERLVRYEKGRVPTLQRPIVCTLECPEIANHRVLATLLDFKYSRNISIPNQLELKWFIVL